MEPVEVKELYGATADVALSVYRIVDIEAGVVIYMSSDGMCCIPVGQTGLWSQSIARKKFYPVEED